MYRYYLEKYILDHVLHILGVAGIAVIFLFNPFAPGDFAEKRVLKLV